MDDTIGKYINHLENIYFRTDCLSKKENDLNSKEYEILREFLESLKQRKLK